LSRKIRQHDEIGDGRLGRTIQQTLIGLVKGLVVGLGETGESVLIDVGLIGEEIAIDERLSHSRRFQSFLLLREVGPRSDANQHTRLLGDIGRVRSKEIETAASPGI
jgi:hypothetical protein